MEIEKDFCYTIILEYYVQILSGGKIYGTDS